ncbi:MAG: hypothetical protein ABFD12_11110, partial [Syntrophorhabdus sp.]
RKKIKPWTPDQVRGDGGEELGSVRGEAGRITRLLTRTRKETGTESPPCQFVIPAPPAPMMDISVYLSRTESEKLPLRHPGPASSSSYRFVILPVRHHTSSSFYHLVIPAIF